MRQFKWIDWNLQKISAHGLSRDEVEAAFGRVLYSTARKDGSFQMTAMTPAGRVIDIAWRYDRSGVSGFDYDAAIDEPEIFVITAY